MVQLYLQWITTSICRRPLIWIGIMVGNGCIGEAAGVCGGAAGSERFHMQEIWGHGLVSPQAYDAAVAQCGADFSRTGAACSQELSAIATAVGSINTYGIYSPCVTMRCTYFRVSPVVVLDVPFATPSLKIRAVVSSTTLRRRTRSCLQQAVRVSCGHLSAAHTNSGSLAVLWCVERGATRRLNAGSRDSSLLSRCCAHDFGYSR